MIGGKGAREPGSEGVRSQGPLSQLASIIRAFRAEKWSTCVDLAEAHPYEHIALYWVAKGVSLENLGRLPEAVEAWKRASALSPRRECRLGWALNRCARYEEARVSFKRACLIDSGDVLAWVGLAAACSSLGLKAETTQALEQALLLEPDNDEAAYNLAVVVWREDSGRAIDLLRTAIRQDGEEWTYRLMLGELLVDAKNFDEAEGHLKLASLLAPHEWRAHVALGAVHRSRKNWTEALNCYRQAHEAAPSSAEPLVWMGLVQRRMEAHGDAQRSFAAAHALEPDDMEVVFLLGRACVEIGELERGRALLHQVAAFGPESDWFDESLGLLNRTMSEERD